MSPTDPASAHPRENPIRFVQFADEKSSTTTTSCPSAARCLAIFDPINPAPPVTSNPHARPPSPDQPGQSAGIIEVPRLLPSAPTTEPPGATGRGTQRPVPIPATLFQHNVIAHCDIPATLTGFDPHLSTSGNPEDLCSHTSKLTPNRSFTTQIPSPPPPTHHLAPVLLYPHRLPAHDNPTLRSSGVTAHSSPMWKASLSHNPETFPPAPFEADLARVGFCAVIPSPGTPGEG